MSCLVCCAAKSSCDGLCLCAKMDGMVAQLKTWTEQHNDGFNKLVAQILPRINKFLSTDELSAMGEYSLIMNELTMYVSRLGPTPHQSYESYCLSWMVLFESFFKNLVYSDTAIQLLQLTEDKLDSNSTRDLATFLNNARNMLNPIGKMGNLLKLRKQARRVQKVVFDRNHTIPLHKLHRVENIRRHQLTFRLDVWLQMKTDAYAQCMQFVNEQWDRIAEAEKLLKEMHSYSQLLIDLSDYLDKTKKHLDFSPDELNGFFNKIVEAEEQLAHFDKMASLTIAWEKDNTFSSLIYTAENKDIENMFGD
ncbi:hypothetical protein Ciccas_008536 [Cichlidogyrus casuarinus]|uniref:Uncharacterized protein n=1 Tax=Cichlidogyrus casuarinus TaxID=1844966 RepID=A0ABD2Q010_9PLAT